MTHAQQPPSSPSSTAPTHGDWAAYDRAMAVLKVEVLVLNGLLGYDPAAWDAPKITIGYIGNSGPGFDDRSWSVFLPHPGRVGTREDQVGSWRTGDAEGIRAAASQVAAMIKITKHLVEQRLLAGWSTRS